MDISICPSCCAYTISEKWIWHVHNQNLFDYLANPVFHRFEVPSLTFSVDFTQKTYVQGANLLKNSRLH